MGMIGDWLKQVVFCMCFLELLYQLVPGKTWQKYLKFTGGLIFILVLMQPILQFLSLNGTIRQHTFRWQIREEVESLQEAQKELEEIQNRQVREGLQRELEYQMKELIRYYGGEAEKVTVLTETDSSQITEANIVLQKKMEQMEECRMELYTCFGLDKDKLTMTVRGEE